MFRLIPRLAPLCLAVACSGAFADTEFVANLTNSQEPGNIVPTTSTGGPRPASFGTGTFVLNTAQTQLTMTVEVHNIDFTGTQTPDNFDNLVNAHIHSGLNSPPANNSVAWGFIGAPFNDNNPTDTIVTPFGTGVGGTVVSKWDAPEGNGGTTLTAQLANLFAGRAYVNFHTVQFAGGEVRGAILIPEPVSLSLISVASIGLLRRRQK